MKVAGAEPIALNGLFGTSVFIGFTAPAADPLAHECDHVRCSLQAGHLHMESGRGLPLHQVRSR
jgi:hypothetical protein